MICPQGYAVETESLQTTYGCGLCLFECQQLWNVVMGLFSLVKFKFDFLLTLRLPENTGRLTFAECRLHFSRVLCLVLGNGLLGVFISLQEIAAVPFSKSVRLDSHCFQANCLHMAVFVQKLFSRCGTERCVSNTIAGPLWRKSNNAEDNKLGDYNHGLLVCGDSWGMQGCRAEWSTNLPLQSGGEGSGITWP